MNFSFSFCIFLRVTRCTPPNKGNDYQKIYSDWCHEFEKYKSAMKTWEKKQAVSNNFHMVLSFSRYISLSLGFLSKKMMRVFWCEREREKLFKFLSETLQLSGFPFKVAFLYIQLWPKNDIENVERIAIST